MFAYCLNNPIMYADYGGEFAISASAVIYVVAAIVLVALTIIYADEVIEDLPEISFPKQKSKTKNSEKDVEEELEAIANQFDIFECKEAAEAMKKYTNKGNIIELEFKNAHLGYVCCDRYHTAISENGKHFGYLYNEIGWCNVYPEGLPKEEWISRFCSSGGGPTSIKIY